MAKKAPGKAHRKGLADKFPDDDTARSWVERIRWPQGPYCPRCGSFNVQSGIKHKTMAHRCHNCEGKPMFTVRRGFVMAGTKMCCRVWAIGIYLFLTTIKGLSSMKLHWELNICQKAAWFLLHRLRYAFEEEHGQFSGPVDADETHIGAAGNAPLNENAILIVAPKSRPCPMPAVPCVQRPQLLCRAGAHASHHLRQGWRAIPRRRWAHMGEHAPFMTLTVRLGDDGQCIPIDEAQTAWQPWQVRRKALEETLIG